MFIVQCTAISFVSAFSDETCVVVVRLIYVVLCVSHVLCVSSMLYASTGVVTVMFVLFQQFGPILDVEIIFNERGSKVRFSGSGRRST